MGTEMKRLCSALAGNIHMGQVKFLTASHMHMFTNGHSIGLRLQINFSE